MTTVDQLIDQTKLARALGVSKVTIHQWTASGTILPEIHEGKVYRYDLAKVRARLAQRAAAKSASLA